MHEPMSPLSLSSARRRIPFAYITNVRTFLVCWLFTLPNVLFGYAGWGTVPAMAFIGYVLMGLEASPSSRRPHCSTCGHSLWYPYILRPGAE